MELDKSWKPSRLSWAIFRAWVLDSKRHRASNQRGTVNPDITVPLLSTFCSTMRFIMWRMYFSRNLGMCSHRERTHDAVWLALRHKDIYSMCNNEPQGRIRLQSFCVYLMCGYYGIVYFWIVCHLTYCLDVLGLMNYADSANDRNSKASRATETVSTRSI